MTVEGSFKVARDEGVRRRHLTVGLSQLAFEALMSAETSSAAEAAVRMENALRCYLADKDADRPAWPYPGFLRGAETQGGKWVEFDAEEYLWRDFEAEADAQGVSVEQLAEHAAFYFAAEANAGRLTQRILEDLESSEGDEQR
jgi:hypothetical protein